VFRKVRLNLADNPVFPIVERKCGRHFGRLTRMYFEPGNFKRDEVQEIPFVWPVLCDWI
jgi:hypothetical protein